VALHSPAPMTYKGSARLVMRLRRGLERRWQRGWITPVAILLLFFWWLAVTVWYPVFVLTRLVVGSLRPDARKRGEEGGRGSDGRRV
jgi:hypothetical protein